MFACLSALALEVYDEDSLRDTADAKDRRSMDTGLRSAVVSTGRTLSGLIGFVMV
jgi:hypothetical protein